MEKQQLEKNRLDLEYHRQLQVLNAVLILGTTGLLSFIGTYLWKQEYFSRGIAVTTGALIVCIYLYKSTDAKLRLIIAELRQLR